MLRQRLLFGSLMVVAFSGLLLLDGRIDGSISRSIPNTAIQGSIFAAMTVLLMVLGQLELGSLLQSAGCKAMTHVTVPLGALLSLSWYIAQFPNTANFDYYVAYFVAAALLGCFWLQAGRHGTEKVLANCGANLLATVYLGLLGGFIVAIRVEFGVWPALMFIATVKSCDIGAYTAGKLAGKHKFSPVISPGKTWEGMAGGAAMSMVVAAAFAVVGGIMSLPAALVFGAAFAFIGQLGDLAESMIKRDAKMKDSSGTVPGFGGILDVVDSPLVAAPFAMLYFSLAIARG